MARIDTGWRGNSLAFKRRENSVNVLIFGLRPVVRGLLANSPLHLNFTTLLVEFKLCLPAAFVNRAVFLFCARGEINAENLCKRVSGGGSGILSHVITSLTRRSFAANTA